MKTTLPALTFGCLLLTACTEPKTLEPASPPVGAPTSQRIVPRHGDLTAAVVKNDLELVRKLLQAGADVDENTSTEPSHRITPVMAAVVMGHSEIAFELLKAGAEVYSRYDGYSARDFGLYNEGSLKREVKDALILGTVPKAEEKL